MQSCRKVAGYIESIANYFSSHCRQDFLHIETWPDRKWSRAINTYWRRWRREMCGLSKWAAVVDPMTSLSPRQLLLHVRWVATGRVHLLIFRWYLSCCGRWPEERPHDDRWLCDPQIIYLIPFFVIISPSVGLEFRILYWTRSAEWGSLLCDDEFCVRGALRETDLLIHYNNDCDVGRVGQTSDPWIWIYLLDPSDPPTNSKVDFFKYFLVCWGGFIIILQSQFLASAFRLPFLLLVAISIIMGSPVHLVGFNKQHITGYLSLRGGHWGFLVVGIRPRPASTHRSDPIDLKNTLIGEWVG